MKLSGWADRQGVHCMTAWRWWRAGKLPVPARQTPSATIVVDVPPPAEGRTVVYARVSAHDQRSSLESQVARMVQAATAHGLSVDEVVTEVGLGFNGRRRKLARLLADGQVATIVVEHRDRLARFGVEYLVAALSAQGPRLLVVDGSETDDDVVRDMVEVRTSMCARLYGRRGAGNRAHKALGCAARDGGPRDVTPVGQDGADG